MFPGQGAQRPGMAGHLIDRYPCAAEVFARAEQLLELPLVRWCTSGSAELLTPTEIAQPAIAVTSAATYAVLAEQGVRPDVVAGHSLGEYQALVAAGVLELEAALRLVRLRGDLMAAVAERTPGTMVAVTGLAAASLERICATVEGVVEVANYNEPHQSVLSGETGAVRAAAAAARAVGAQTVELRVAAPFHCSLMAAIEDEFAAALAEVPFADPQLPLLSSVTGAAVSTGARAREVLRQQLAGPVRWVETLTAAMELGTTDYVEVGPGRVLSGLAARTLADPTVRSTNDARRLAAVARAYR